MLTPSLKKSLYCTFVNFVNNDDVKNDSNVEKTGLTIEISVTQINFLNSLNNLIVEILLFMTNECINS